jgi:hypothetical protein
VVFIRTSLEPSSPSFTGLEAFFFVSLSHSLIKVIREVREWTVEVITTVNCSSFKWQNYQRRTWRRTQLPQGKKGRKVRKSMNIKCVSFAGVDGELKNEM